MPRLIDSDNMQYVNITVEQAQQARELIDSGIVTDCCGDPVESADCIDGSGDVCVDEDMYSDIKQRLGI